LKRFTTNSKSVALDLNARANTRKQRQGFRFSRCWEVRKRIDGCQGGAIKAYNSRCGGWEIGPWEATVAAGCKEGGREGGRGMGDWNLGDDCCLRVARREGEGVLELLGFSFGVRRK
jgi:hypothetical protein